MNLSSRTSSKDVQNIIETSLDKRSKTSYGPPLGKKMVIFIDDMNMPEVDVYVFLDWFNLSMKLKISFLIYLLAVKKCSKRITHVNA